MTATKVDGLFLTSRVARLDGQTINEQVQEYDVALSSSRVGMCLGGPTELSNKFRVNVVQHVGPDFTDVCGRTEVKTVQRKKGRNTHCEPRSAFRRSRR